MLTQKNALVFIETLERFVGLYDEKRNTNESRISSLSSQLYSSWKSDSDALESHFRNECESLRTRNEKLLKDARLLKKEVDQLDAQLAEIDKHYKKTKEQLASSLQGQTLKQYEDSADAFAAMEQMKNEFRRIAEKHAANKRGSLTDNLNFAFSTQRKNDYRDLILLKNTVDQFHDEISNILSMALDLALKELDTKFTSNKKNLQQRRHEENQKVRTSREAAHKELFEYAMSELNRLFPEQLTQRIFDEHKRYENEIAVPNTRQAPLYNSLFVFSMFTRTPIIKAETTYFRTSNAKPLINGNHIELPTVFALDDKPWLIVPDGSSSKTILDFANSLLYSILATVPAGKLSLNVIDPENHGGSISPLLEAKNKLPGLFNGDIITTDEDAEKTLRNLNGIIDDRKNNLLSSKYANIFECYRAKGNDECPKLEVVFLFDFPRGMRDESLVQLRNILRNGPSCGVYAFVFQSAHSIDSGFGSYKTNLDSARALCTQLDQRGNNIEINGCRINVPAIPNSTIFSSFINKYLLHQSSSESDSIAFSAKTRALAQALPSTEAKAFIESLQAEKAAFINAFGVAPKENATFPSEITIGCLRYPEDLFSEGTCFNIVKNTFGNANGEIVLPLSMPLGRPLNLLLSCDSDADTWAIDFTHKVLWSFLSSLPALKARIAVISSVHISNRVAPFLGLKEQIPDMFDGGILSDSRDIEEYLLSLSTRIDSFLQYKLAAKFNTIVEYNEASSRNTEAMTFLVIYDYPNGLSARGLALLERIVRNGGKCGIYTMICRNAAQPLSPYSREESAMSQIENLCIQICSKNGQPSLLPYGIVIEQPEFSADAKSLFVEEYAHRYKSAQSKGVVFSEIFPSALFTGSSAEGLSIPVGIGSGGDIKNIEIGTGTSHHCLLTGATGGGKSTLLHTLILSSMAKYSPDELELYLLDFKNGTEFKVYESYPLPHIKLLGLDAMQEFGESVLESLVEELSNRATLFKETGVNSVSEYVKTTGKPLPRILAIMDEFQVLFNIATNRKVASNCAELAKKIVTEGRSYGVHLLLSTQSTGIIRNLSIESGVIEQMRIRIGLKLKPNGSDVQYMFGTEKSDEASRLMSGQRGTAVISQEYTEQRCESFVMAYCDPETKRRLLKAISNQASEYQANTQVFEAERTQQLIEDLRQKEVKILCRGSIELRLGEPIKIAPPLTVKMDRKRRHNMLICGSNAAMRSSIIKNCICTALLHERANILLLDGERLVDDDYSTRFYDELCSLFPAQFCVANSFDEVFKLVATAYEQLLQNKKYGVNKHTLLVIKDLQWLDTIKRAFQGEKLASPEKEVFPDVPAHFGQISRNDPMRAAAFAIGALSQEPQKQIGPDIAQQLAQLSEVGSTYGVHILVSAPDYRTITECLNTRVNHIPRFPERIAFSLGDSEAFSFIGLQSISSLRNNMAYYTDSVHDAIQFKPFASPSRQEYRAYVESAPRQEDE